MMNIVGNQIIHEAAGHYGWKEGSTEKTPSPWNVGSGVGTHRRLYFQRAITEKYYGSISDIKQARLFKLNFNRSDTYNLISTINYYRNNSAWVKTLL